MLRFLAEQSQKIIAVLVVLALGQTVQASSPEAWQEFRQDVEAKCMRAVGEYVTGAKAEVDPFGSESFGFATIQGQSIKRQIPVSFLCVYDKRKQTVRPVQLYDPAPKLDDEDIERCGTSWNAAAGQGFGPFMRKCLRKQ